MVDLPEVKTSIRESRDILVIVIMRNRFEHVTSRLLHQRAVYITAHSKRLLSPLPGSPLALLRQTGLVCSQLATVRAANNDRKGLLESANVMIDVLLRYPGLYRTHRM